METRRMTLTFDKAVEWYNAGGELREVALQVFTEDELKSFHFSNIKTFEDVLNQLSENEVFDYTEAEPCLTEGQMAALKVNLIRKVLNKGYKMNFTNGRIYYPYNPSVTQKSSYYEDEIKRGDHQIVAKFSVNGQIFNLLGGDAYCGSNAGLGYFGSYYGVGLTSANVGALGCATEEIAKHFGKYFAKEIFEMKYGDFVDFEWIESTELKESSH